MDGPVVRSFGGTLAFGEVRTDDMDVMVLAGVPLGTSALHRELPGTALAVVPVENLAQDQGAYFALDLMRRVTLE